jgi:hypothetical protein
MFIAGADMVSSTIGGEIKDLTRSVDTNKKRNKFIKVLIKSKRW